MVTLVFLLKDSFRPLRHSFPDDCEIVVGRCEEGAGFTVAGDGRRFAVGVPSASLSAHHATLTVGAGRVTVTDHGSLNGTFQRIAPARPTPVEEPLWFGDAVSLHLDGARWDVPREFSPLTADALAALLRSRLDAHHLVVELGGSDGSAWHIEGEARLLTVRPADPARTVSGDDLAWVRLVVNAYNTAVATRRATEPWRFTAVSPGRVGALDQCRRAAPTRLPVLLLGPTGVGKELLAQGLHDHGPWSRGPFVAVNCAELAAERLGSELFGHARGAFTGASTERAGLIETASGGTLFLDEVGEMPAEVQAMLLRFLESDRGEYRRMGESRTRRALVRIVAATHRDLVAPSSNFRRDLYFRLAGVVIEVPAPSPEDLRAIARELFAQRAGSRPSPSGAELERVLDDAARRTWGGGVRALRHAIDRCLQMRDPSRPWIENWRAALEGERSAVVASPTGASMTHERVEAQPATVSRMISDVMFLTAATGTTRRSELARRLGMTYQGVDQRLQAMGLALDDREGIDRRLAECTTALHALVAASPGLASLLRGALRG